jgi:hypothetical protein
MQSRTPVAPEDAFDREPGVVANRSAPIRAGWADIALA